MVSRARLALRPVPPQADGRSDPRVVMKITPTFLSACLVAISASSQTVSFTKLQLSDLFYSEGVAVADINGDGHADVVAGPIVYRGPDFKQKSELAAPLAYDPRSYSNAFIMGEHDFNYDGAPDVWRVGWPGRAGHWLENPGRMGPDWTEHELHPEVGTESPQLLNLVGDERPELIFAAGRHLGWAAPSRGSAPGDPWQFHPITPKDHWQRYTHGLGAGDINGDDRLDLLTATGWFAQPANLSGDPHWEHHPAVWGTKGGAQMYAFDINGDGLNDVLTTIHAHEFGISWFEQNHDATGEITWVEHPIIARVPDSPIRDVQFSQAHAIEIADINGDGLTDFVSGKRRWAHGPTGDPEPNAAPVLYWFQLVHGPDGAHFEPHLIDDSSGVGTQFVVQDMNQDSQPDVVISNKSGVFVFLQD